MLCVTDASVGSGGREPCSRLSIGALVLREPLLFLSQRDIMCVHDLLIRCTLGCRGLREPIPAVIGWRRGSNWTNRQFIAVSDFHPRKQKMSRRKFDISMRNKNENIQKCVPILSAWSVLCNWLYQSVNFAIRQIKFIAIAFFLFTAAVLILALCRISMTLHAQLRHQSATPLIIFLHIRHVIDNNMDNITCIPCNIWIELLFDHSH